MNNPIKKIIERVVKKYFPNEIDRSDAERLINDIVQIINISNDVDIDYLPLWYVSNYYVRKEDLPTVEEIGEILKREDFKIFTSDECIDYNDTVKRYAQALAKRIGKEAQ
ncbi:hypothetical protein DRN69_04240 [Candidatus Pacearchaeota archaeon]|nr:MAG: hypothetical protein DRN69_04240 [Candidatus Pacearchaeota archaeon]